MTALDMCKCHVITKTEALRMLLAALRRLNDTEASRFSYGQLSSNGSNINIKNNGHTVVVNLPPTYKPDASVVYRGECRF